MYLCYCLVRGWWSANVDGAGSLLKLVEYVYVYKFS